MRRPRPIHASHPKQRGEFSTNRLPGIDNWSPSLRAQDTHKSSTRVMRGIYRPVSICDNNQATKAESSLEVLGQYQTGLRGRKQLSPAGKVARVSGSICAVTHELGLVRGCCYTRGF